MANQLNQELLNELYGQESGDPLLMLVTLSHASFPSIYLVNNTVDILSRGNTFLGFPMELKLPNDDGETERQVQIEFDNVSLELISELRSIVDPIEVKVEMILASQPDVVQTSYEDLLMRNVSYDQRRIRASLYMDSFLNRELTSERYTPTIYPGLF